MDLPLYVSKFTGSRDDPRPAFAVLGEIRLDIQERTGRVQIHVYESEAAFMEGRPRLETITAALGQSMGGERRDGTGQVVAPPSRIPAFREAVADPAFASSIQTLARWLVEKALVHPVLQSAVIRDHD